MATSEPAPLSADEPASAGRFMEWFAYLRELARSARLTAKEGCGLSLRRSADGTEIGLEQPPDAYGVVIQQVGARQGETPGTGMAQPYIFNGTKFVPAPAAPVRVFNKSKQQPIGVGYRVTWDYRLGGFPFVNWSDCTAG